MKRNEATLEQTAPTTTVEIPTVAAGIEVKTVTRKDKPPIIPSPNWEISGRKPTIMELNVPRSCYGKNTIPSSDGRKKADVVHHVYVGLGEYVGRTLPDGVNPRSHDPECLKSSVSKKIEETLVDKAENFHLANRGITIIAEHVEYNPKEQKCRIVVADPENQGLADGATSDAVLAKVQTEMARTILEKKDASYGDLLTAINNNKIDVAKFPEALKSGFVHLEIWEKLEDRQRLADLVEGRNTSRQVRGWSMADFRMEYDWLKEILEAENAPFKNKVGYEENSGKDVTVLDVLSILTLFHPEFDEKEDGKDKAPTVAYSNKGRMDSRLTDEKTREGYKKLAPLIPDILRLHDFIYVNFEGAYEASRPKARLGRRQGVKPYVDEDNPYILDLTGMKSRFMIPSGFIFPLLAAFRALIVYKSDKVGWRIDPFEFFDKYGKELVSELIEQVEAQGGNPNVAGKKKLVYTAIHAKARLLINDEMEERRSKK